MNLGTKITIYKFTPQVFTLTQQKPRFAIAGSTVANCGPYSPQMETVWFAAAKRNLSRAMTA